jgi:hypothetical protein
MRGKVLAALPFPVQVVVGLLIHRGVVRTLHGQGVWRYTPEERDTFRGEVWQAMSVLLIDSRGKRGGSEEPFWLAGGNEPTEVDATLFGFIASCLVCAA